MKVEFIPREDGVEVGVDIEDWEEEEETDEEDETVVTGFLTYENEMVGVEVIVLTRRILLDEDGWGVFDVIVLGVLCGVLLLAVLITTSFSPGHSCKSSLSFTKSIATQTRYL